MKQKTLKIGDKKIFDKYLSCRKHDLSVFNFVNIYIWKKLYKISWAITDNNLCVFFKDKIGCFLYLPPLGEKISSLAVGKAFTEMNRINVNREISRIENIEQAQLEFFIGLGLEVSPKSSEYVCDRKELAELKGNKFKSKRASFNYFVKNYQYEIKPFQLKYKKDCLNLYNLWGSQRRLEDKDKVYSGMIEDSRKSLEVLLSNHNKLGVLGYVVLIKGKVKAFTFGYDLNKDTFCILFEITDLSLKGLAQFIFREFSKSLKNYHYINIMDDSCLENLKKVKESYHPVKLIPAYITREKHA